MSLLPTYLPSHLVAEINSRIDALCKKKEENTFTLPFQWGSREFEDATGQLKIHDDNLQYHAPLAVITWVAAAAFIVIGVLFTLLGDGLMAGIFFSGAALLIAAASYATYEWVTSSKEKEELIQKITLATFVQASMEKSLDTILS